MNIEDRIRERYQGDQGRDYYGRNLDIPPGAFPWVTQLRAEKIAPYVKSTDVVMEYGAGFGWNISGLTCRERLGFDLAQHQESLLSEQGEGNTLNILLPAQSLAQLPRIPTKSDLSHCDLM
jgi:hypothetical protein